VFYSSALEHLPDDKKTDLLRDAVKGNGPRKPIDVRPPSMTRSSVQWKSVGSKAIRAGFEQLPGVGEKTAVVISEARGELDIATWGDLQKLRGIGPKTTAKLKEFAEQDDPFEIHKLDNNIRKVKKELASAGLPEVTHTSTDLPYEQGHEFRVVWLGTVIQRNIRDIFEQNRARTGEELKKDEVKDPHLAEWAQLTGLDENDQVLLKIDRWRYPGFKKHVFEMEMGQDLVLVEGIRPKYVTARQIKVKRLWVIEP
jgi:DNA polymerase III subunit alpha